MKVQKIMISIFLKDEKIIRISLDKIFIFLVLIIFLAPYGLLTFKMFRQTTSLNPAPNIVINNESDSKKELGPVIAQSGKHILPDLAPAKITNKAHIVKVPVVKEPQVAVEAVEPTGPVIAESNNSLSVSSNPYLITNLQMYAIGRDLSVDFVLTKKKLDNKMSAGSVYVEVIDKNQNAVVVSGKAPYKFTMARPSKFFLNVPIQYKADKIKIHITDAYSDVQNKVLEYPIPSSTEL